MFNGDELEARAYKALARFFSYRVRTSREVFDRLKRKGFSNEEIERILESWKDKGILDDEGFARRWVHERKYKYGPLRLRSELYSLGIDDVIVESAIAEVSREEWLEILRERISSEKFNPNSKPERAKLIRRFLTRGFPKDMILEVLRDVSS